MRAHFCDITLIALCFTCLFTCPFICPAVELAAAETPLSTPHPLRVVVLGDSITAGFGLDTPDLAYPALLAKRMQASNLPGTVVNAGVSGDTTSNGLQRLNWVLREPADVLVIALGSNDALRGVPAADVERNLHAMIGRARSLVPGVRVLLAGALAPPNMGESYTAEFRSVFRSVAESERVAFAPFLLEGVAGIPAQNQADGIHPTASGQLIIAANLWPTLEPLLRDAAAARGSKTEDGT